jgi:2-aminoethylphosphonate-pyruvate transaminase
VIHCETTTGIFNPIEEIGVEVARAGAVYIVDAMSSFGAIPVNLAAANADFLISSANKCIEGVPGFGFVLAAARYRRNHETLARGMAELGFEPYLAAEDQSYIITTYRYPDAEFRFEEFYTRLSELGLIIYPGKLSQEPCFRIGTIGRLDMKDIQRLLDAIRATVDGPRARALPTV